MNPVAFEIGRFAIRWYGVFVALGFLAGFYLMQHRAGRTSIGRGAAADLVLLAMLGGVVGARVLYVLQHWAEFSATPWEIIRVDHGGLVFYGGFLGAVIVLVATCAWRSLSMPLVADLFAPVLPLGHAFGRVGCFLNGCCHGKPASGALAVRYTGGGDPVFPIQLVSSVMNLSICVVLLLAERRVKRRGQLFALYLMLYGAGRFLVEFGRGDVARGAWGLTSAQVLCLFVLPAGVLAWLAAARWGALPARPVARVEKA